MRIVESEIWDIANKYNGYFEKNTTTSLATSYYAFNGQTIAMRQGSTVSFLHPSVSLRASYNHLGSASLTTNNAGARIAEAKYASPEKVFSDQNSAVMSSKVSVQSRDIPVMKIG
jgi:hypothetical protein